MQTSETHFTKVTAMEMLLMSKLKLCPKHCIGSVMSHFCPSLNQLFIPKKVF